MPASARRAASVSGSSVRVTYRWCTGSTPGGADAGIDTRGYYRVPTHLQPAMAAYRDGVELPGTARASATNLALPMGPTYGQDVARAVVDALDSNG